jgi:hypothetical protein
MPHDRSGGGDLRLVRVVTPHFVAAFETDGIVRRTAPILRRHLMGKTDDEARAYIKRKGWKASVVDGQTGTPPELP